MNLTVPCINYFFSEYITVLTLGSTALTNRLYNVKVGKARDEKEKCNCYTVG